MAIPMTRIKSFGGRSICFPLPYGRQARLMNLCRECPERLGAELSLAAGPGEARTKFWRDFETRFEELGANNEPRLLPYPKPEWRRKLEERIINRSAGLVAVPGY